MSIEFEQLGRLKSIQDADLECMLSWRNAPAVRKNMYTTHEISREEHLTWWEKIKASDRHQYFLYEYKDEPCGIVGFTNIDSMHCNSAWVFYTSPTAPKGTGSRMEILALDYAFHDLRLHKLHCEVLGFNTAVIRLHKKFGFAIEGIFRDQHRRDDSFVDVYRLGLTAVDWDKLRVNLVAKFTKVAKG